MTPEEFNKWVQSQQSKVDEFSKQASQVAKDAKDISKILGR